MRSAVAMLALAIVTILTPGAPADPPTTAPAEKLPFIHVDLPNKKIRIDCEVIGCTAPLEFFCCVAGGPEHEAILRSRAKPSHVHLALLMLGLKNGEPVKFIDAERKWLPPTGPPLHITCQWAGTDGKAVDVPAYRMMRDVATKKAMPELTWIFTGSHVMPDGAYGADVMGYLISVVNFELSMIDVPELASNSNETLEWVANDAVVPPPGTAVTMTIEPAPKVIVPATEPATKPANRE